MIRIRSTVLSALLGIAAACGAGPKDDALFALTGHQVAPDPSTLQASDPRFALAMQAVFDGADPVNFAREAAERHPIHLMQVRGDPVVPNAVTEWPLTGSEPLARVMGLQTVTATVFDPDGVRGFVTFTGAFGVSHQPQLEPGVSPRVTAEMVGSVATFLASGGTLLPVNDAGAIE